MSLACMAHKHYCHILGCFSHASMLVFMQRLRRHVHMLTMLVLVAAFLQCSHVLCPELTLPLAQLCVGGLDLTSILGMELTLLSGHSLQLLIAGGQAVIIN